MDEPEVPPPIKVEKLLLATDGSNFSQGAEKVAIAMAAKSGAKLHVLSAVIRPLDVELSAPRGEDPQEREANEILNRIEAEAKESGVECNKIFRVGDDPHKVIVKAAAEIQADMIVMGRRGRRGLARLMLGDATAKVMGSAHCSVMVVPEAGQMWHRVLLGTDGSASSAAALSAACGIVRCCGMPLTVLSAKVPIHSERRQAEAQPIVDRALAYLKENGVDADGLVENGMGDEVILATAEKLDVDLIVLGSFGRTGFGRVLFGSKTERVINHAKCAVLVVRCAGGASAEKSD